MTIRNILSVGFVFLVGLIIISAQDAIDEATLIIDGDGTSRRITIPILMYHYVSPLPPNADAIRENLTLDPVIFRQHVQWLSENGYNTISLYEIDRALDYGEPLPENPVVLSFDDGYSDAYDYVFPILQEFEMTGTFFVITEYADFGREGHLTWEQIEEMSEAGMNIEAHTKTHPNLRERDYDFLVFEIMGSVESIEAHTGIMPSALAYPVGLYDDTVLDFMETTPIQRAVTTQAGIIQTTENRFEMPRMRITNTTGVAALQGLLNYQPSSS